MRDLPESKLLGPSTGCIVDAALAKDRRIPAIRLLATGNPVQLGYGARSRRIWAAENDRTGAIAGTIPPDKALTKDPPQFFGRHAPRGPRPQPRRR